MTDPRAGGSAPESQSFPLPPFVRPEPSAAPWPLDAELPPFSAPQSAASASSESAFIPEPPPLPEESAAPEAELAAVDDAAMPWEMPWETDDAVADEEVAELDDLAAPAWSEPVADLGEPAWLSLDEEVEEEPAVLAELAPAEVAEAAEEVPAWLTWMDDEERVDESVPAALDLVDVGDLGALPEADAIAAEPAAEPWAATVEEDVLAIEDAFAPDAEDVAAEPSAWAEPLEEVAGESIEDFAAEETVEDFAAEPAVWAATMEEPEAPDALEIIQPTVAAESPFAVLAGRLERLAAELRSGDPAALLATAGRDPLEVLILGYALGQMHAAREGARD